MLLTISDSREAIARNIRDLRIAADLTQEGLSNRSGVPLPTLRKFEQRGLVSLDAFLKISMVLGISDLIVSATKGKDAPEFLSIDDVLKPEPRKRKKGRIK